MVLHYGQMPLLKSRYGKILQYLIISMQIKNNQEFEDQNIDCSIRHDTIPRGKIIECDYKKVRGRI
jgi:hypothetical protein